MSERGGGKILDWSGEIDVLLGGTLRHEEETEPSTMGAALLPRFQVVSVIFVEWFDVVVVVVVVNFGRLMKDV